MKPKLKDLQLFTQSYFRKNCPAVKWKNLSGALGLADFKKCVIYLRPDIKPGEQEEGCGIGDGAFFKYQRRLKLKEGEQYFLTLLHEIGHFKITKIKAPKRRFYFLKRRLEKEYPNDLDQQLDMAQDYFQTYEEYMEFRLWWVGSLTHMEVEEWAIKEFKKRRKEIREILGLVT